MQALSVTLDNRSLGRIFTLQLTRYTLSLCQISTDVLSNYDNSKHYVYLQAVFPDRILEKIVMVSFHSVYLFIQTDMGVYTPNSRGGF